MKSNQLTYTDHEARLVVIWGILWRSSTGGDQKEERTRTGSGEWVDEDRRGGRVWKVRDRRLRLVRVGRYIKDMIGL